MSEIQQFPHEGKRVETGPIQFGDDWPGVFIRGDNALWFSLAVRNAAGSEPDMIAKHTLIGLSRLLASCNLYESPVEHEGQNQAEKDQTPGPPLPDVV